MWSSILYLAGLTIGWVVGFYFIAAFFPVTGLRNLGPNPSPAQVSSALTPLFQGISLIIPVGVAIQLAAALALLLAFRELRRVDSPRFSTPSIFMIIFVVGLVLVAVAVYPLLNSIPGIIATAPSTPGTTPSSAFFSAITSLVFSFVFIAVGGILWLIGVIGGSILGLWRVGSRYDQTIIKVGAIFLIIPLLNIVAPILILIGANDAKGRLAMPH
jgi:hypothetical protein